MHLWTNIVAIIQGVLFPVDVRTSAGNNEISQEIIVKPHLTWQFVIKNTVLCLFHHLLLVNASMHTKWDSCICSFCSICIFLSQEFCLKCHTSAGSHKKKDTLPLSLLSFFFLLLFVSFFFFLSFFFLRHILFSHKEFS